MNISKNCVELLRAQAKQVLPWLASQLNASTLSVIGRKQ